MLKLQTQKGTDIFQSPSDTIVIPINCVGVMGAGIARDFATRYPHIYTQYHKACADQKVFPGFCYAYRLDKPGTAKRAYLVTTKRHWKEASTYGYVDLCAKAIRSKLEERVKAEPFPIDISIPALGCGCGRLEWQKVHSILIQAFVGWKPEVDVVVRFLDPYDPTFNIPKTLQHSNHYL